jgi:ParB family chromosome partitioning protein
MVPKKDFAAMEGRRPSGDSAARAALRSRMAHPTSLRLDEVQSNPLNPRYDEEDPAVRELADTLQRVGQLQPALVVSVEQYLQAYPSQRGSLGSEPWVVIVGNRRLAAARLAGRAALDVRVVGDIESAEDFEDRILIENIQRKDLPPLLEAEHLQRRLDRPGQSMRSVAAAIGKSHAYVQQRLDLLRMIPELQALFREGAINIRIGRQLGILPETEQRLRLAAGPPFLPEEPARSNGTGPSAPTELVNPVSNGAAPSTPSEAVNQVSSGASASTPAEAVNQVSNPAPEARGEAGTSPVNPVSTPPTAGAADPEAAQPDPSTEADGERTSPAPSATPTPSGLEAVQLSVAQWLDSALAELDHALPRADGAPAELTQALAETQRHILAARESLRATRT